MEHSIKQDIHLHSALTVWSYLVCTQESGPICTEGYFCLLLLDKLVELFSQNRSSVVFIYLGSIYKVTARKYY